MGKKIILKKLYQNYSKSEIEILKKMGIKIIKSKNSVSVFNSKKLNNISISTKPYPGFPTDLQAQLMVLMTQAKGLSKERRIFLKTDSCTYQS